MPTSQGRFVALDGLRGFLAVAVVLCHIGTYHQVQDGSAWGPHANAYLRQAGAASVRHFFMITGFLFWSKALANSGRLPAWRLYRNRFWRIMPLYLALVAGLLAWALVSGGGLREAPGAVLLQLAQLLPPGFFPDIVLNGYDTTHVLRQSWTLRWEWLFYLALPGLALGLRSARHAAAVAVVALALGAWWVTAARPGAGEAGVLATFAIGMATAAAVRRWPQTGWARRPWAHALAAATVVGAPLLIERGAVITGNLLFALLFVLVVYGNDLWGLLAGRASRLLGEVSYSIYLLHMVVLALWLAGLEALGVLPEPGLWRFWAWMAPSLWAVAAFSLLTFRHIEQPGIERSRGRSAPAPAAGAPAATGP